MMQSKIHRGVAVAELVLGESAQPGAQHVRGVRTTRGVVIEADLLIDAMGRRSKLADWLKDVGARAPHEEASAARFAYYTRHYRARDGRVPIGVDQSART
jgi:flavin-dependent dehydrogenase